MFVDQFSFRKMAKMPQYVAEAEGLRSIKSKLHAVKMKYIASMKCKTLGLKR